MTADYSTIVDGLSSLIAQALTSYEIEFTNPGSNPDAMDDKMKFYKERAANLRKIRLDFEDEMSRALPYSG